MKSLNSFLELYKPKPDEQKFVDKPAHKFVDKPAHKFVDKHVVAKVADRNGNGDDVFNAAKVKSVVRTGHGYETGDDEKVYEGLSGKQSDIDLNKNGKIDAADLLRIRALRSPVANKVAGLKAAARRRITQGTNFVDRPPKYGHQKNLQNSSTEVVDPSLEQILESAIREMSERDRRVMVSVFSKLTEENKEKFLESCTTESGLDAMLDFSIKHRNAE